MATKNFLKLLICLLISTFAYAGEPGTELPIQKIEKPSKEKIEAVKEKKEPKKLVTTTISLPKNPLNSLFYQDLGQKIDKKYAWIVSDCTPLHQKSFCKKVKPKRKSVHFNQYYYYLNQSKKVYAIIAFSNKRIGTVRDCRAMIKEWETYLLNFDLQKKSVTENVETSMKEINNSNLDQLILVHENKNKIEVNMSCYPESFRDIKSYFSLSVLTNEK
jgi:hypothetical protein